MRDARYPCSHHVSWRIVSFLSSFICNGFLRSFWLRIFRPFNFFFLFISSASSKEACLGYLITSRTPRHTSVRIQQTSLASRKQVYRIRYWLHDLTNGYFFTITEKKKTGDTRRKVKTSNLEVDWDFLHNRHHMGDHFMPYDTHSRGMAEQA